MSAAGKSPIFLCSFSSQAAELPQKQRTPDGVLRALNKNPRISTFDMSEHAWLWRSVKSLLDSKLIEEIKEPYPWHRYRLTDAGRAALAHQGPDMTNVTTQCHACGGGTGQARACECSIRTDAQRLAAKMNGVEYGDTFYDTKNDFAMAAKALGLVIAYGACDDLLELEGAIFDECSAPKAALLDASGFIGEFSEFSDDEEDARRYFERKRNAKAMEAIWNDEGNPCWTIQTGIPHATFDIMEDGEVFSRGIVFALADLAAPAQTELMLLDPESGAVSKVSEAEAKLTAIVRAFIEEQKIGCAETIYQSDRVIENAYKLIEQLADVVGYHQFPED